MCFEIVIIGKERKKRCDGSIVVLMCRKLGGLVELVVVYFFIFSVFVLGIDLVVGSFFFGVNFFCFMDNNNLFVVIEFIDIF